LITLDGAFKSLHKGIPVRGRGGPQGCEMLRLPHFLHNRLADGGEVVSLTRRPPFTPQEYSWYLFLLEAESTQGHSAAGRISSNEKIHLIGIRSRDLAVCSIVPQPTTLPRAPLRKIPFIKFYNVWLDFISWVGLCNEIKRIFYFQSSVEVFHVSILHSVIKRRLSAGTTRRLLGTNRQIRPMYVAPNKMHLLPWRWRQSWRKPKCYHITPWFVVHKRTIPTERPPLVSEVSANFCG
jgi:hypothetical protein